MDTEHLENYPNHRASDVIVKEGEPQVLVGRFKYGPLDWITYPGEVDIRVMQEGEWKLIGTENIDKTGTVTYVIPQEKVLPFGMHRIKMTVKKNDSSLEFFLAVVHPKTEVVVFSIDGSFAGSMSSTGLAPHIRCASDDVVRFWQEMGYLIVYITGRPDMQLQKVKSWLFQHNIPRGMVSSADTYATDPLGHKAYFLRNLITKHEVVVRAAYSNSKDIGVFSSIDLSPEEIFIIGEVSNRQRNLVDALGEDYIDHLAKLRSKGICRPQVPTPEMINLNDNSS